MFEKDMDKILKVIKHPDNTRHHWEAINNCVKLFYGKWSSLDEKYDENRLKVMEAYLNLTLK